MGVGLELLERGPNFVIAASGSLFITVVKQTPQLGMLEAIDKNEAEFVARQKRLIRSLFVIRDIQLGAPPSAAFRMKSASLMERYGPKLIATAQVIEGAGFKASIARGFATSITLAYRHPVPTRALPTVPDALTWMSGIGDRDPALTDVAGLAAAIAQLHPGD